MCYVKNTEWTCNGHFVLVSIMWQVLTRFVIDYSPLRGLLEVCIKEGALFSLGVGQERICLGISNKPCQEVFLREGLEPNLPNRLLKKVVYEET